MTKLSSSSVGLGFRRDNAAQCLELAPQVAFWEVAPENWMQAPPDRLALLERITADTPLVCHGLSLSIGGPDPLPLAFVDQLKVFLDRFEVHHYSEHLSYCAAGDQLYDLLPIPFQAPAVDYVVDRIQQVQDRLQRPLILENISYYVTLGQTMSELDFLSEVLKRSGAQLLLDVNNVYVNSVNHGYDPVAFISGLPRNKVVYGHLAGHREAAPDLLIDTHGAAVRAEVFELLSHAYDCHGVYPTLLERDFNYPATTELAKELAIIAELQKLTGQQQQLRL